MKKCVVIGVTGGIAVYKALDIISALKKKDIDVRVIMTESATKFVNPITFQSLSNNAVAVDTFQEIKVHEIQHISLAQRADLMLIAPATANIIGKVANGIADDMLSTTIMACKSKVIFAPAMNTNMYENRIVQDNIEKLKGYGYGFIEPGSGRLACGDIGVGKLADVSDIVERVLVELENKEQDLIGKKVLISAGPTIAPIDPVRFITNRSTGKMGYSIAKEARDRGADVVLVSGPTNLPQIKGIKTIKVNTNEEMKLAMLSEYNDSDIVIKSAAVADYKPLEYSEQKIKKSEGDWNLVLTRDSDILRELGERKIKQILVGFAAESNNIIENARTKIHKKNLDYIVANDITANDAGFGSEDNRVTILSKDGTTVSLDKMRKSQVACNIFDMILGKRELRFSLYNRKYLNQYKGGILNLYAEIILNSEAIEIDRPFTYKVPLDMEEKVKVGQIVKVPFGVRSKPVEGFILDLKAEEEMKVSFKMKSILSVENEEPVITEDDLKLINFLREEYLCKYIDAIRLLIPVGILKGAKSKSRNVIVFINDNL